MGKVINKGIGVVVDATKNAPKSIGKATQDLVRSAAGQNSGNYFKNLGESAVNFSVNAGSAGMTGTKDLGGTNNIDTQLGNLMGKSDAALPTPATTAVDQTPDPYLEEELKNARKSGRASTIIGGASDTVGNKSARRTLLESL